MTLPPVAQVLSLLGEGGAATLFFPLNAWTHPEPAFLSLSEEERAKRFTRPEDRDAFLAGRWMLRLVLAECCGREPADVPLMLTERGKPVCSGSNAPWFNLTHSAGWLALALCSSGEVGVDMESTARPLPHPGVAERWFGEKEKRRAVTPGGFYDVWTRKEALLKALGTGLSGASRVEDSLAIEEKGTWRFTRFRPAPEIVSHVVTRGAHVTAWTWRRGEWTPLPASG